LRFARLSIAVLSALALLASTPFARASASSAALVEQARAHERVHEDEIAVRRYSEAIRLDPSDGDAYLGLGALRLRTGDAREAERVYTALLQNVPSLHKAKAGLARAHRAMGLREQAAEEMLEYATQHDDVSALRELAEWQKQDERPPALLATWRAVLAIALRKDDATLAREARTMVRALQILVAPADPATSPIDPNATRAAIAQIAKRRG
jgi:tetratricopeptide (TPR) repeat protein